MNYFQSAVTGLSIVAVVSILVFGMTACEERNAKLHGECIAAGGSVINTGGGFHCIRK